jgi:perosamine synthetase
MLPIVRGKISHTFRDDLKMLLKCFFLRINDKKVITDFENILAAQIGHTECVTFSHARTALYFTLKSLDLKPGDHILMPSITIKAILDVVLDLKLRPVFVDSDLKTACFDLNSLRNQINKFNPRVCLLTYLFGLMPDMDSIVRELKNSNIFIIEDFSQALNASYKGTNAGLFGSVSIYSASTVKTLDTYGGGLAFTSDIKLINSLRHYQLSLANIPRIKLIQKVLVSFLKNIITSRYVFSLGLFQILKYLNFRHNKKFDRFVGLRSVSPITKLPKDWFFSYTSVQAAVGLKLLKRIEVNDSSRINFAQTLISKASNIKILSGGYESRSVFWQLIALPEAHNNFRKFLYMNKIDSAYTSLIEISQLPTYQIQSSTPNADYIYNNAVYLPCYASLNSNERAHIINTLKKFT